MSNANAADKGKKYDNCYNSPLSTPWPGDWSSYSESPNHRGWVSSASSSSARGPTQPVDENKLRVLDYIVAN